MEPLRRAGSAGGFSRWRAGLQVGGLQGPGPTFPIALTAKDYMQGSPGVPVPLRSLSIDSRFSIPFYTLLPPVGTPTLSSLLSTHMTPVLSLILA